MQQVVTAAAASNNTVNNSFAFILAAFGVLIGLVTLIVTITTASMKEAKSSFGLSAFILTLVSFAISAANIVLAMVVYGTFSAKYLVNVETQLNSNLLSAQEVNNRGISQYLNSGGFQFGYTFGLATVFIGIAAGLYLISSFMLFFSYRKVALDEKYRQALTDGNSSRGSERPLIPSFSSSPFKGPKADYTQSEVIQYAPQPMFQQPQQVYYTQPQFVPQPQYIQRQQQYDPYIPRSNYEESNYDEDMGEYFPDAEEYASRASRENTFASGRSDYVEPRKFFGQFEDQDDLPSPWNQGKQTWSIYTEAKR